MKKTKLLATCSLTLALGLTALAGCSQPSADTEKTSESNESAQVAETEGSDSEGSATTEADTEEVATHEPPLMTAVHEGRFESMGATGCYTCHGATEDAEAAMEGATPLPADHYVGGDPSSLEMDPGRNVCITCHPVDSEG